LNYNDISASKAIKVPPRRINEIVHGLRGITADTALRLAAFFGTEAQSWLNLQTHYDAETARGHAGCFVAYPSVCACTSISPAPLVRPEDSPLWPWPLGL